MLRRFGNAIFAAALLAVASSEYLTAVRADAYANSVYGDSAYDDADTPAVIDAPRSGSSADDALITPPAAGSPINVEEEPVTAKPSTPAPATNDSGSSDSAGPTITVEEEPVVAPPSTPKVPASTPSGPTITVPEEPVIVGSDADRAGDASPTPATTTTKGVVSPVATPAATPTKPVAPAATPAASTVKPAVVAPAATPAASTVKPAAATPVPVASMTPTVVPGKKRKDCDPMFPAEDPVAAATPAPSTPMPAVMPAKIIPVGPATAASANNGAVKAPTDSVSDSAATSFVQREAPAAAVVAASTKTGDSDASGAGTSLLVPVVAAAAVAAVMGVAAFRIKKNRDEAKLDTPREQFGQVRATPAGNAVL